MAKQRLLERIRYVERNAGKRNIDYLSENDKISIIKYINKLLNIKKGNLITDKNLGMPDFTDFIYNYPECIRDIKKSVKSIIAAYEPRIKDVKVDFISKDESDISLHFQIMGTTVDNEDLIVFDSIIDKSGDVSIKN